jgi:ribosomal protein S18 acetylase RimI-like enzyme
MKGDSKKSEFTLREASEHDIPLLSVHHRKMFEEIWEKKGQPIHCSAGDEMEQAYSRKLSTELEAGSCKSWLIEKGDHVVASGAITIVSVVPTPNDLSSKTAYMHSIYTEPGSRGQNLAGRIVLTALEYCKANGIRRVLLSASKAGKPLYERIRVVASPEMMRISLE